MALPIALSHTLFSVADRVYIYIYINTHKIFHIECDSIAHYFMIYVVVVIVLVLVSTLLLLLLLLVVVVVVEAAAAAAAAAIGKAIPLQALTGPEGSRRLRLPDFKTIST